MVVKPATNRKESRFRVQHLSVLLAEENVVHVNLETANNESVSPWENVQKWGRNLQVQGLFRQFLSYLLAFSFVLYALSAKTRVSVRVCKSDDITEMAPFCQHFVVQGAFVNAVCASTHPSEKNFSLLIQ